MHLRNILRKLALPLALSGPGGGLSSSTPNMFGMVIFGQNGARMGAGAQTGNPEQIGFAGGVSCPRPRPQRPRR